MSITSMEDLKNKQAEVKKNLDGYTCRVLVCSGTGCIASGAQKIYEEIYTLCLNMEGMMEMFSKELEILDRNTVKLMIDEMEEELAQVKASVAKQVEEQVAEKVAEQVAQAKESIARELEEEKQKIEEEKQRAEEEK